MRMSDWSSDVCSFDLGISLGGATHEMSAEHWDRIIDVNIRGVVNGIRAVYPSMIQRGSGQIVNVASGAGLVAPPFVAAYAMTKHRSEEHTSELPPLMRISYAVFCSNKQTTTQTERPYHRR